MSEAMAASAANERAPSLTKRMACFAYEGLILFGLLLIPGAVGALFVAVTGQQHSLQSDVSLQVLTLIMYAVYFSGFWSARGQTLPMQTWRIRVVTANGQALSPGHAVARYVASWLWVAPALLIARLNHWPVQQELRAVGVGIAGYALLTFVLPHRQFLHDVLCGTRLATAPPEPRRSA